MFAPNVPAWPNSAKNRDKLQTQDSSEEVLVRKFVDHDRCENGDKAVDDAHEHIKDHPHVHGVVHRVRILWVPRVQYTRFLIVYFSIV